MGKYVKIRKSEKVVKWVGSGGWSFRLVQSDHRNCRLTKDALEKGMKNKIFYDFLLVWGLALGSLGDFALENQWKDPGVGSVTICTREREASADSTRGTVAILLP